MACLKVHGSGSETELASCSSGASSSSSDQMIGGSAGGSAGCLTFHHSPGGREMRCVRQGASGIGGGTGGKMCWKSTGIACINTRQLTRVTTKMVQVQRLRRNHCITSGSD